jgi:hypothetical protein
MKTSLLRAEGLVKRYRLPHGLLCAPAPLVGALARGRGNAKLRWLSAGEATRRSALT